MSLRGCSTSKESCSGLTNVAMLADMVSSFYKTFFCYSANVCFLEKKTCFELKRQN